MCSLLTISLSLISTSALASDSEWKFGLGLGYSPNHIVALNGTATSSGTGTTSSANYVLEYKAATEFEFDVRFAPKNSWGFISGFHYGGERKFSNGTINGLPISASAVTSSYQTHFLYIGTAYRWDTFYFPLGLTYGLTKMTPADDSVVDSKNGVGALIGVGWFIGEHIAIEYVGRSMTTELKTSSSSGTTQHTGMISSALLSLKLFL